MCYEFVHACKSPLIDELTKLIGADNYFLICIGNINYLYSNDAGSVAIVKGYMMMEHIVLHKIPEDEMFSVINHAGTKEFQTFHGSRALFNTFREMSEAT
jgi:hypothetical protein